MKLLRNSLAYSGLSYLQKGIGFLLLPVYTAYLSPSDFGIVAVVLSVVGFLMTFYPLGADASAAREYFTEGEKETKEVPKIWGSLLLAMLLFSILMTALLWTTHSWFLDRFLGRTQEKSVPFSPYMALGLVLALCSPIRTFFGTCLQVQERAFQFMRIEGSALALRLFLLLSFVVYFQWNAFGILLASAITEGLFALLSLFLLRDRVEWRLDFAILRKTSSYALPMVPYNMAGWATTYLASLVLNYSHGTHEAGLYSMAANISMILTFFIAGFHQAYYPTVFKSFAPGEKRSRREVRRKTAIAVAFFAMAAFGLSCFGREVLLIMAKPVFRSAATLVAPLALAAFFHGVYVFYSYTLSYHRPDARLQPILAVAGMVASIGAMLYLVPRYSMMGAAWSSTIGVGARLLTVVAFCRGREENIWPHLDVFVLTILTVLGCASCAWVFPSQAFFSWVNFFIKSLSSMVFILACGLVVYKTYRQKVA